jgi:hypothetical protein
VCPPEDDDVFYLFLQKQKIAQNEGLIWCCRAAGKDLVQTIGMVTFYTACCHGSKVAQTNCEVWHISQVLDWAVTQHGGDKSLPVEQRAELAAAVQKTA